MKNKINYIIYALLLLIGICTVLLFIKPEQEIITLNYDVSGTIMMIGDTKKIVPNLSNNDMNNIKYVSSNPEVATIDNIGNINAISKGVTIITASYNDIYTELQIVVNKELDKEKPTIEYDISSFIDKWNNDDVTIDIKAFDNEEVSYLKYTDNDSEYFDILDKKVIEINENGIHNIDIVCKDSSENTEIKSFVINIDKTMPEISFSIDDSTLTEEQELKISVKNEISGIKSFKVIVDLNNTITEYEVKESSYTVKLDKEGTYKVKVLVESNNLNTKTETKEYKMDLKGYTIIKGGDKDKFRRKIIFKGRTYTQYIQQKFPTVRFWGECNISKCGCGPTSLTNILSGYIDGITPKDVGDYMGEGTFDRISATAKHFGMEVVDLLYYNSNDRDKDKIKSLVKKSEKYLKDGAHGIALITAGRDGSSKLAGGNHFIPILGFGNDGKLLIMNSSESRKDSATLEELYDNWMSGGRKGILFIKWKGKK